MCGDVSELVVSVLAQVPSSAATVASIKATSHQTMGVEPAIETLCFSDIPQSSQCST